MRQARQSLGVTLAVTGSVQREADRVRITINLVDTESLRQLKSRFVDIPIREFSTMQDTVVVQVAELLELELRPAGRRVLTAGATAMPGAYDFYLQGRGYLQRNTISENVDYAFDLFNKALEQDPGYALARAGLGEAYWYRYQLTKEAEWAELARRNSEAALEMNDQLAPIYITLALVATGTGRYEEAVTALLRALEIDPVNDQAHRQLGRAYEQLGRTSDAEATYKKAIMTRPNQSTNHSTLGVFYFRVGRYDEAAEQLETVIDLAPDNFRAYSNLGGVYNLQDRLSDSAVALEKSLAIRETYRASSNLATTYFDLGDYSDAAREFERALTIDDLDYRVWRNMGAAYRQIGDLDRSRVAFERAAEMGERELEVNPRQAAVLMHVAVCYSMLDDEVQARGFMLRAVELEPQDVTVMYNAAIVNEQLGDREQALEWLGQALREGYPIEDVQRSVSMRELRQDDRFRELVGQ